MVAINKLIESALLSPQSSAIEKLKKKMVLESFIYMYILSKQIFIRVELPPTLIIIDIKVKRLWKQREPFN